MKTTAIYSRQSKDRKESLSIDAQIDKCIALCTYKGKEYKIYTDRGFSGKNTQRPAFEELMSDIKNGLIDEVIVYRVDRISRNLNDFTSMVSEFDKHNVTFASATESFDTSTPMGRAMMYLLQIFAQLERETIAERNKDNALYRATLGRWTSGEAPFGYYRKKILVDGKQRTIIESDPEESKIVQQFFDWYLAPEGSVRSVVSKANLQGIKTRDGFEWGHAGLSRLFKNAVYSTNTIDVFKYFSDCDRGFTINNLQEEFDGQHGMMFYRHNDERIRLAKGLKLQEKYLIIGEHQGIILGNIWVKVQEKLDENKLKAPRSFTGDLTYLNGIVKCGVCGGSMGPTWAKSGNGKQHYFKCRRQSEKGTVACSNRQIRIDKLEILIEAKVLSMVSNKKFIEDMITQAKDLQKKSIVPLEQQYQEILDTIKEKENSIQNLIINLKSVSSELLVRQIEKEVKKVSEEINILERQLVDIKEKIKYYKNDSINKEYLISNYTVFPEAFKSATLSEKRLMIRGILRDIEVKNGDIALNFF